MTRGPRPLLLYGSFTAIYLIWGSSFAATKFMVQALPPYLAAGARFTAAGALLAAVAALCGAGPPRAAAEWRNICVMALFHVVLSSGLNVVALQHVASNQSALLNATAAMWIPLLSAIGPGRHPLTMRVSVAVAVGLVGALLLLWPSGSFNVANFGWQLLVVFACFSWAVGTRVYRSIRIQTSTLMFFAFEMLAGGLLLGATGLSLGEAARWSWSGPSLAALAFLTLFSSCLAYTAFGYLMSHTTPARLSTYAYVNPAIAALLGWLLLGERMSGLQLAGTGIVLLGVVLVSLPDAARPATGAAPSEPTG